MECVLIYMDENACWNLLQQQQQPLQTESVVTDRDEQVSVVYHADGENYISSSLPLLKSIAVEQHPTAQQQPPAAKQRKRMQRKTKATDDGDHEQAPAQQQQQCEVPLFQKKFLLESGFFLNDERSSCVSVAFQPSQNVQHCLVFSSNKNVISLDPVLINDFLAVCDQINQAILSNKYFQVSPTDQHTFIGVKRMFSNLYVWITQEKHSVSLNVFAWIRFNEYLPALRKCIATYAARCPHPCSQSDPGHQRKIFSK